MKVFSSSREVTFPARVQSFSQKYYVLQPPPTMTIVFLKRAAVGIVLTAGLSACVSEMPRFPIEPGPSVIQPMFTSLNVAAPGRAQSNRVKYSDTGMTPASGRQDGAPVEMRATQDKSGMTLVEVVTGTFDDGPALARIDRVQMKVLNTDLAPVNERPQSRYWSRSVAGLMPGDQIQVTVSLRYASAPGTLVATLTKPVVRSSDLAVTALAAPQRIYVQTPAVILATVQERHGDGYGARANCVLSVDDVDVDQATYIWVDAGGAVTCQFMHTFPTVGEHDVSVSLRSVSPADYDLANNTASTTVRVVPPGTPIATGFVQASDELSTITTDMTRGGTSPLSTSLAQTNARSMVYFFGTDAANATGRIERVDSRLSADGREILTSALTEFSRMEYDNGVAFVSCMQYGHNGEEAQSCVTTYRSGVTSTWFHYSHASSSVTYYGQYIYCETFQQCNVRTRNESDVTGSGARYGLSAGSALRLELAFTDAAAREFVVDRTVTLQDRSADVNYSYSGCFPNASGQVCYAVRSEGTFWFNEVSWPEF